MKSFTEYQHTFPYATWPWELTEQVPVGPQRWSRADRRAQLAVRCAYEKARRELPVYYYRIGHTVAFPLPVDQRPPVLPPGIPGWTNYPWIIWLWWSLEERWRVLHAAWRQVGDDEAGALLQNEIAALDGWESFLGWADRVQLPTGHSAGLLALFLSDTVNGGDDWDPALRDRAWHAAERHLDQVVRPWFAEVWADRPIESPNQLHNIPTIVLVRNAQLASVIGHELAEPLEQTARRALAAWCAYRTSADPHTEGTSYDGYLMDHITEWIGTLPDRDALVAEHGAAFDSLIHAWTHLALPARPDLHVPLGDVEPEMPFWMSALLRLTRWRGNEEGAWLLERIPPVRLPAAALALACIENDDEGAIEQEPASATVLPNAVTLRTGWSGEDLLVAVGASRSAMSHLHNDGGQIILGWRNRCWITDPGYQQYRRDSERDYTIGVQAHSGPVIDDAPQAQRAVALLARTDMADGGHHVALDLTECYAALPPDATVRRDVWLLPASAAGDGAKMTLVVACDRIDGLPVGTSVDTHWQGGAHLAWAFQEGWGRLSDGEQTLWIGAFPHAVAAEMLVRHEGSRGPLTLAHHAETATAAHCQWWLFGCVEHVTWSPPVVSVEGDALVVNGAIALQL